MLFFILYVQKRENTLREQLSKMEFLYDLDPNKPLIKYDKGDQKFDDKFDPMKLDVFPGGAFSQ